MDILILEDELAIRTALSRGLQRAGHSVVAKPCVEDARDALKKDDFDLIITDLKLPDGSGFDLVSNASNIPFIVMSGYAIFDEAVKALRMNCVDFFIKPISISDVVSKIETMEVSSQDDSSILIDANSDGVNIIHVEKNGIVREKIQSFSISWDSMDSAKELFHKISDNFDTRTRQILAELMQINEKASITINHGQKRTSFLLECDDNISLDVENNNFEHKNILENLSDKIFWYKNSVSLECIYVN